MAWYSVAGAVGALLVFFGMLDFLWEDRVYGAIVIGIGIAGCAVCAWGLLSDPGATEAYLAECEASASHSDSDGGVMPVVGADGTITTFIF